MKPLQYRDYLGSIDVDQESGVFFGKVLFINDTVTFEGASYAELVQAFEDSVEDYLETCKLIGKEPDKRFTGSLNVRIKPQVHRNLALKAANKGVSINSLIADSLEEKFNVS
ncbi:type II toxin-antitoxin system HicB family antitoxin [Reichenbachiella ulvae]|uniref:Type II toxin-antitoxin system HicB family antitoxin n=1 Tax=Reichenbachiella ulvae TaxID=2980104 RepID=A0ABT3CT67_9BACT|nr:type II toxin-antitoxin system HicB family antitoxin [Reichenbachiella ulvae]MCV9386900.1 type II toxin-antitoxin system HicB family antitoxin [Reichenbachiella ulvae]